MKEVCSVCGSPVSVAQTFCSLCQDKDRREYLEIRNYLRANPRSNAMQVANATGISVSKITRYIREGILTTTDRRK